MAQEVLLPVESMPIGVLAARVQADPALAMELPGGVDVAEPGRWARRLRFVLEAAVFGELDERGLVESMSPIPAYHRIISFKHLGIELNELWEPAVDKKLAGVYGDEAWGPVFRRTQTLIDDSSEGISAHAYYTRALYGSSPGLVARFIGALHTAAMAKRPPGSAPAVDYPAMLREEGVSIMRRAGVRGHKALTTMMRDFEAGDRNRVLKLQEGSGRLAFTQAIGSCPVGTNGLTVAELEDRARQAGKEPFGCPAIKYGQIPVKLAYLVIDDAERFGLFERLDTAR